MNDAMERAVQWLIRAQDTGPDDGFASHFHLNEGWYPSYPEVTGYIIPTVLEYAKKNGRDDLIQCALKTTDWLLSIQLPDGAFQGRLIGDEPVTPVIFNTGMILFGLADAYLESNNEAYKTAAMRAADWLLESQDEDGVWRKHLTLNGTGETHIYHTRVSWAILRVFDITKDQRYVDAITKHIDWAITHQQPSGWFAISDLFEANYHQPLIHFLVYTIRGTLECGLHQSNQRWIAAAVRAAEGFRETQLKHNMIYGRYDKDWNPAVDWKCLTGIAQISIVYMRIYQQTQDKKWLEAADRNFEYLLQIQGKGDEGLDGALAGSDPVDADYMPLCYLSWATKFLLEALLLREELNY